MSKRTETLLAARMSSKTAAHFINGLVRQSKRRLRGASLLVPISAQLLAIPFAASLAQLMVKTAQGFPSTTFMVSSLLCLLARSALSCWGELLNNKLSAQIRTALRFRLYQHLTYLGDVFTRQHKIGFLLNPLVEGVESLHGYIKNFRVLRFIAITNGAAILLLLVYLDITSALILAGMTTLLPLFFIVAGIATQRASVRQFEALSRMSGQFLDRLRHLTTLRLFGTVEKEAAKLEDSTQNFRNKTMAVLRLAFLSATALDCAVLLSFTLIAKHIWEVPTLGLEHKIFIMLLTLEYFSPLRALSAAYHDRAAGLAGAESIRILLAETSQQAHEGHKALPDDFALRTLDIRDLTYSYPNRPDPALCGFNCALSAGDFVGIAGESGVGKSTILHLLLGKMRPDAGTILINGMDAALLDLPERQSLFTVMAQRPMLFHGSLRDNLLLAKPDADDDQLWQILARVALADFVKTLPQQLDTFIGEGGYGLSGGQSQRLALARVLLQTAPIVLLDEPTAGLDRNTAQAIMHTIKKTLQDEGRTILMVSHDTDALAFANWIIHLEKARTLPSC